MGAHRFPGRVSSASAHLHPKDPDLMGLSSSKGSCTPRSPGQSLSHWGGASTIRGLWGGRDWQGLTPPSTASGTAKGWLAGHSLSLPGLKEGRSTLCSVHFRLRRVPGHVWGPRAVWSGSSTWTHGQDTAVDLGPSPRSPPPRPACQPTFLCPFHTVDTGALVSAVPQPARTGEEGQAEQQPSLHRSQGRTQSIYFG